jgi:protocatechuate 4,5-dioxygenase alpha chain
MNPQLEGIDGIPGTYIFDISKSVKTLRLNRFFWRLAQTEYREQFIRDEEEAYARAGLSEEERALVGPAIGWVSSATASTSSSWRSSCACCA